MGYIYKFYWLLFWIAGATFIIIDGQMKKDFQVLEFAVDGIKTVPTSLANLTEHNPGTPFPDIFTLCWRSRTSFARGFWPWNYIEIPHKPGERFLAFTLTDNATHSWFTGKDLRSLSIIN